MLFCSGDIVGFSGLLLRSLFLVAPLLAFFLARRRWRLVARRRNEIRLLALLIAQEEAAAAAAASTVGPAQPQCAVCFCPTTTRCSRCKAVRYCSGKCQIIHWRKGHKDECHPPTNQNEFGTEVNQLYLKSALREEQSQCKDESLKTGGGWYAKPTIEFAEGPASSFSTKYLSGDNGFKAKPLMDVLATDGFIDSSSTKYSESNSHADKLVNDSVNAAQNSDLKSEVLEKQSGRKDDSLETDGGSHPQCAEEFAEGFVIPSICATEDLTGTDCSVVSLVSNCPEPIALEDKLVSGSVYEGQISSIPVKLNSSLAGDNVCGTYSASSTVDVTSNCQSLPSESCDPTHPVYSINSKNKSKIKTHSLGLSKIDCGSSTSSSMHNSSDKCGISEPSTSRSEQLVSTLLSSKFQIANNCDSISGLSFNFPGWISSAHQRNSKHKNCILDNVNHSVSDNSIHSIGASSSNDSDKQGTAPSSAQVLNFERSNSLVQVRSPEKILQSEDHTSSSGELCVSNKTSSKPLGAQIISANQFEKESSVLHCRIGVKTSMWKAVQGWRPSSLSKHHPLGMSSDISSKNNCKILFPYEQFVELYNWDKVDLRPCGLVNCGNSCYANCVLQCLAFTRPLMAYLLQGLHSEACLKKEWCFTCELEKLVSKAKEGISPISPIQIMSQLKSIGSHLGHGKEEDAHEFLRYGIDTMQSVCLKEAGVNEVDSLVGETTLVQLIFGGYLRSKIKCMKCHSKSEQHERIMDLSVEIHGNIGTLEDALAKFTATEILDGENKYHCYRCKSYEKAKKKLTVLEAPNILTVALKRFQSDDFGKLHKSVQYQEVLNMAPYMSGTSDRSPVYRLYAVVVHLGVKNAASGHYVCYVKNIRGKWFKIDDSLVKPAELESVLSEEAYMLFYARCCPRAPSAFRNAISLDYFTSKSKCMEANSSRNHKRNHFKARSSLNLFSGASRASPRPEDYSYRMDSDGMDSFDSIGLCNNIRPEGDLSSCSSSLLSCSDDNSCSAGSTQDSTSTDEYSEFIFGDSGRFSWNSSLKSWDESEGFPASPSH